MDWYLHNDGRFHSITPEMLARGPFRLNQFVYHQTRCGVKIRAGTVDYPQSSDHFHPGIALCKDCEASTGKQDIPGKDYKP